MRIPTAAPIFATVLVAAETPPLGENDKAIWPQTDDGTRLGRSGALRPLRAGSPADGTTQEIITNTRRNGGRAVLAQRPADGRRDDILAARVGSRSLEGETLTLQRVSYVDYTQNEVIPTELE